MKTYAANIVSSVLVIKANSEEEAELKYSAYFGMEDECPCGQEACDCCHEEEDVFHIMEEL